MLRGRRSLTLDLKSEGGAEAALRLAEKADALIEGFRPGVMERLGLGPEAMHARNPRLVYGRMTGWGQDGPARRARRPRHQLHRPGRRAARDRPRRRSAGAAAQPGRRFRRRRHAARLRHRLRPDRGARERPRPGRRRGDGRRRRAAGDDVLRLLAAGQWSDDARRQRARLRARRGTTPTRRATASTSRSARSRPSSTPSCSSASASPATTCRRSTIAPRLARAAAPLRRTLRPANTRDEWCAVFEGSDACFAPVLTFADSRRHPHVAARGGTIEVGGIAQPAPAPRFDRTPGAATRPPPERGSGRRRRLARLGLRRDRRSTCSATRRSLQLESRPPVAARRLSRRQSRQRPLARRFAGARRRRAA